ncbi:hypothetical protein BK133_12550 [Paenibacillus sp. FSL H8-0548]|uniref:hypothetical protein n=1 Tax=Paenibacillus sp. FSL H8-0548 TaxID=1920422 RepID=UPI0009700355|nr:hypothetical protein [Paenibacillus sp. FSL H8-0548]OMF34614.1 hypothetical protein BK133_12550 [Paenibacillus sp. FSL H8-0548]
MEEDLNKVLQLSYEGFPKGGEIILEVSVKYETNNNDFPVCCYAINIYFNQILSQRFILKRVSDGGIVSEESIRRRQTNVNFLISLAQYFSAVLQEDARFYKNKLIKRIYCAHKFLDLNIPEEYEIMTL